MSAQSFTYTFNIQGNSSEAIGSITQNVTGLNNQITNSLNVFNNWKGSFVVLNQAAQFARELSQAIDQTLAPGAALNASLADLEAISGETGEGLKTIEKYAREAAKTFGGSAAQSVESYKLLLSQLTPELAKILAKLFANAEG